MSYKIEKGIPIHKAYRSMAKDYPYDKMDVGDSFFVPYNDDDDRKKLQANIMSGSYRFAPKGWKFTSRSTDQGVRCWRKS